MKFTSNIIILSVAALIQICNAAVSMSGYTKELFSVSFSDIQNKLYTVEGSTCTVEMQYYTGSASGIVSGEISRLSSTVTKTFKDGHIESKARLIIGRSVFIEDNFIGYDENQNAISKPIIITNNNQLSYLQTADIQGIMQDKGNGNRVITYMQNPSGAKQPYPVAKRPDETKNYNKEVFKFDITVGQAESVRGAEGAAATMIGFTCSANTSYFKGKGLDTFVDTRLDFQGQPQTLSARYILEGQDDEGRKTRVYIENAGIDVNGINTEPIIITDNPKWAYIETAPTHGTSSFGGGFQILLWTVNDPSVGGNTNAPTTNQNTQPQPNTQGGNIQFGGNQGGFGGFGGFGGNQGGFGGFGGFGGDQNNPFGGNQGGFGGFGGFGGDQNTSFGGIQNNPVQSNPVQTNPVQTNPVKTNTCSQKITQLGYKCCTDPNCKVYYVDESGSWGAENGEWCGCDGTIDYSTSCPKSITDAGYKCCSACSKVLYSDDDGDWSIENNEWCGLSTQC